MVVSTRIEIDAPNIQILSMLIRGSANLVMCKFSEKAKHEIEARQKAGSTAKRGIRTAKDFHADYEAAKHIAEEGWCGIPAPAFRAAMISACRLVGFPMTQAKLGVFVVADGYENDTGNPLVKITKGEPQYFLSEVRLPNGTCDLRARPRWAPGWEALVTIEYDADMMSLKDITNLMMRVGKQVGLCEGRPDSKKSCGQGWGLFDLVGEPAKNKKSKKGE
jgi:hypothetical protein